MEELHTDGNEIAGILREVFCVEVTASMRTCQSCRQVNAIGAHRLYHGAGYVLRCPHCGDIAASIVELPGDHAVSLHGTWNVSRSEQ